MICSDAAVLGGESRSSGTHACLSPTHQVLVVSAQLEKQNQSTCEVNYSDMQLFFSFETEGSSKTKSSDIVHTVIVKAQCDL